MNSSNPFEVLGLDPGATEEQIVHKAGRLRQRCADEATLTAIRQAVQALTGNAEDRQLHALLAHPQPAYQWPALEQLVRAHRRPPAANSTPTTCPTLDVEEFAALLRALLADELEITPESFEPVPSEVNAIELFRQAEEAQWQKLLCDPGG
jgi:hypothetical protein